MGGRPGRAAAPAGGCRSAARDAAAALQRAGQAQQHGWPPPMAARVQRIVCTRRAGVQAARIAPDKCVVAAADQPEPAHRLLAGLNRQRQRFCTLLMPPLTCTEIVQVNVKRESKETLGECDVHLRRVQVASLRRSSRSTLL